MRWLRKSGESGYVDSCRFVTLAAVIGILLVSSLHAETVVLDFEDLATPGEGLSVISSYSKDGFTLRPIPENWVLAYWHSDDGNFAGSTALFAYYGAGDIFGTQITRDDGLTFDLRSIMLSEWQRDIPYGAVTLSGTRVDNSEVSTFIKLDGTFGFETFSFPFQEFTSLKELRLYYNGFQYDNLVFNVIPEPCTLVLLAVGALSQLRRR